MSVDGMTLKWMVRSTVIIFLFDEIRFEISIDRCGPSRHRYFHRHKSLKQHTHTHTQTYAQRTANQMANSKSVRSDKNRFPQQRLRTGCDIALVTTPFFMNMRFFQTWIKPVSDWRLIIHEFDFKSLIFVGFFSFLVFSSFFYSFARSFPSKLHISWKQCRTRYCVALFAFALTQREIWGTTQKLYIWQNHGRSWIDHHFLLTISMQIRRFRMDFFFIIVSLSVIQLWVI